MPAFKAELAQKLRNLRGVKPQKLIAGFFHQCFFPIYRFVRRNYRKYESWWLDNC
jgi:hypothetical protein